MANFFQPGPSSTSTSTTPSPAAQAEAKFRTEMLGRILGSMAGTAPSFASFAAGGPAQRSFPGGFEGNIASLLQAMNQPGAFTSTSTGTAQGATPSGISDISQLAGLAYLISQASGYSLADILKWAKGSETPGDPLGSTAPPSDFLSSLPSGDQPGINFTPDPYSDPYGMTMDPSQGMSSVDPNYIPPDVMNMLLGL